MHIHPCAKLIQWEDHIWEQITTTKVLRRILPGCGWISHLSGKQKAHKMFPPYSPQVVLSIPYVYTSYSRGSRYYRVSISIPHAWIVIHAYSQRMHESIHAPHHFHYIYVRCRHYVSLPPPSHPPTHPPQSEQRIIPWPSLDQIVSIRFGRNPQLVLPRLAIIAGLTWSLPFTWPAPLATRPRDRPSIAWTCHRSTSTMWYPPSITDELVSVWSVGGYLVKGEVGAETAAHVGVYTGITPWSARETEDLTRRVDRHKGWSHFVPLTWQGLG